MGFIMPHKFFQAKYGQSLRELISSGNHLSEVVHFGDQQIFPKASTYTCLLFLDKHSNKRFHYVKAHDLNAWKADGKALEGEISADKATEKEWNFAVGPEAKLFNKLSEWPVKLADIAERIAQGIRTSANEVYVLDLVHEKGGVITAHSRVLNRDVKLERKAVSLFLQGREIKPYHILPSGKVVIMPYTIRDGHATLIPEAEIQQCFPLLHAYLTENKTHLVNREKGRFRGVTWFRYGRQQNIDITLLPKLLVPDIANRMSFALDEGGDYAFTSGYGIILRPELQESPKYILALLNSSLLDFYLKGISTTMRGGFFRYFTQFIEQLPIRMIDFSNPADKTHHARMVELVETMLKLHKELAAAKTSHEKTAIQRQIDATDRQIDQLVYKLYGLTKEEIKIVEEAKK
jgi:hypothetical protein